MTPQLYSLKASLSNFIARHHPVVFIASVLILLAIAIYMLTEVLSLSNVDASKVSGTDAGFDKKTAARIKELQSSSENQDNSNLKFPSPRPNPFQEKQ